MSPIRQDAQAPQRGPRSSEQGTGHRKRLRGVRKIRNKELGPFTIRLATMLEAGLPLVQCLGGLAEQTDNETFHNVVEDLRQRIEAGDSFAEALANYPQLFNNLYVNMVKSGESGGSLPEVLARLGGYMEASAALKRRVVSAMTYPVMVLGMSIVLTVLMILFIVPKFAEIYEDFDSALPAPTQFLVNLSFLIRENVLIVAAVLFALAYAVRALKKTPRGAYLWDRYVLRTPVAGKLIIKIALARMSRTFASLVRSGVPILRTFEITSQATGNTYLGTALTQSGHDVEGGSALAPALKRTGVFPPMLIHMVSAGEKTGNVDGMLEKVADFYEDEVSNMLEALSSMIEPLLMAVLGVVIGGIVICMFLPIFKMHEIVGA